MNGCMDGWMDENATVSAVLICCCRTRWCQIEDQMSAGVVGPILTAPSERPEESLSRALLTLTRASCRYSACWLHLLTLTTSACRYSVLFVTTAFVPRKIVLNIKLPLLRSTIAGRMHSQILDCNVLTGRKSGSNVLISRACWFSSLDVSHSFSCSSHVLPASSETQLGMYDQAYRGPLSMHRNRKVRQGTQKACYTLQMGSRPVFHWSQQHVLLTSHAKHICR